MACSTPAGDSGKTLRTEFESCSGLGHRARGMIYVKVPQKSSLLCLTAIAFFAISVTPVFAADIQDLIIANQKNYENVGEFEARVSTEFHEPGKGVVGVQQKRIAGAVGKLRCIFLDKDGIEKDQFFRDGDLWYWSMPSANRYEITTIQSLPSRLPLDPREAGTFDAKESVLDTMRGDELKSLEESADKSGYLAVFSLNRNADGNEHGNTIQEVTFSANSGMLPIKVVYKNGEGVRNSVEVTYSRLADGAYLPSQIVYLFYGPEGDGTDLVQRVVDNIELVKQGDGAAARLLEPPAVPKGAVVNRNAAAKVPAASSWLSFGLLSTVSLCIGMAVFLIIRRPFATPK